MSDLPEKDFKVVIINMLKELKESMIKEVTEGMMITFYHVQNVNRHRNNKKKGQMEFFEVEK